MATYKTPRQRFVEAMRAIHDSVRFWAEIQDAADAFADQECEVTRQCAVKANVGRICVSATQVEVDREHESCRASLRAEIRGDKP